MNNVVEPFSGGDNKFTTTSAAYNSSDTTQPENTKENNIDPTIHKRLIILDDGISLYVNKKDKTKFLYDTKKKKQKYKPERA